ncbi:chemotaxis protein CheB [Hymenobacter coalescens]
MTYPHPDPTAGAAPEDAASDLSAFIAADEDAVVGEAVADEAHAPEPPTARRPAGELAEKFPIVALGGSAGSIDALEKFFLNLAPDTGAAFVVVVHLSPDAPSHLHEVLQRYTAMPVLEVEDGMRVRPNHVYVIPADRDMSLLHGTLLLFAPTQPRGHRLPIDAFLQSLARDARERAVCIILSGLGSDGSLGLKMVMENFGMVMVQDPDTAEYASMPRMALATEFVDHVLPPELLPARLQEYLKRPLLERPREPLVPSSTKPAHALQKIFLLIRTRTGHDFSFYKRNTLFRRIERRMNSHQIKEFTHYVRYLQDTPHEVDQLFKELLIGVTKFFRDPEAYAALKVHLLHYLRQKPQDTTVRVWAPGCSTGEEAYSLAMVVQECLDELPNRYLKLQLFATDINPEAVEQARTGLYPDNIEADVSPERLKRFFVKADKGYQIRKEVRDTLVFAVHNLNKDAPFIKLDLLVCRNLLIYLSAELQKNLIPVFHYALNPGALLFLGPSENLTSFHDLFAPLDVKWKISRRLDVPYSMARIVNFPFSLSRQAAAISSSAVMHTPVRKEGPFATLIQKLLLRTFAPPAVVINGKGEILFVNGRTGKYLEPAPGLSALNVFDMAREELSFEISAAVHRAQAQRADVVVDNVKLKNEGGYQQLRLTVKYLDQPEDLAGLLLVVFEEVPGLKRLRRKAQDDLSRDSVVASLEKELQYAKQRLQTTIEEMESSLEELKSTNEELQSANEELQSTNEEAMTNKEEMQSLNEELMTLNVQYLNKTEELSQAANDMKNLLDATEIATIFLDHDLTIKRFTPSVTRIINLLPTDVGRPITHFASNLRRETLADDVRLVLDRLTPLDTNIQTTAGQWYAMRLMPYRTLDNYISGVVITFTNITPLKNLEERLQMSTRFAESIVETVRDPLLVLDEHQRVQLVSRAFAEAFHVDVERSRGLPLAQLSHGAWRQPALLTALSRLLETGETFDDLELTLAVPGLGRRRMQLYGRRIVSDGARTGQLLLGVGEVQGLD